MEKKDSSKTQDMRNQNLEAKNPKTPLNSKNLKDKPLPWWVEFLFVQIGLPDKLLIKFLKTNKKSKELINNNKKYIFLFLCLIAGMAYFYPVVKNSKNKLDCQITAQSYITQNKKIIKIDKEELKMLSTNFCNGGDTFNDIQN